MNQPGQTPPPPEAPGLDPLDKRLLDRIQADIPFVERPWSTIGQALGLSEADVLQRLQRLLAAKVIRQMSPIFDTRAMGYGSVLVAARVHEGRIDAAAAVVSAHPGVSHNYRRDAEFNLWFTLATPPGKSVDAELARLAKVADFERCRALPVLRTHRIGVQLALGDDDEAPRPAAPGPAGKSMDAVALTAFDKRVIRVTQGAVPLVDRPFDGWCWELGIEFPELQKWIQRMRQVGVLRRIAAILHHRRVGFTANGMGIWRVPPELGPEVIERAGQLMAGFPQVTHCYERQIYEDWPYNLYTMIHARSEDACLEVVQKIAQALRPVAGEVEHRVLFSTVEYKKARLRYFEEED